jgi:hypothetical protein
MKTKLKVFLGTFFLTLAAGISAQTSNLFDLTDTWNNGATTFDAIKMVVTDTDSAADSNLINLSASTGGAFAVRKDGDFVSTLLNSDSTNGNYSLGLNALDSITVGSGLNNIAIGENAGTAITTSDNNILIGTNAGAALTSGGYDNVIIGDNAGAAFTGPNSVIIGNNSVPTSTGDLGIVAIGDGIHENSSFNSRQYTAVGYRAGYNGIGDSSVYMGYRAGFSNTANGNDIVAIGHEAAYGSISPSDSVFIGKKAGYNMSARNVVIGSDALNNVTGGGTDNIAIGQGVGASLTSGGYNILIGRIDALSATDNDQLVVGNGTHNAIAGYMGARSDLDYSAKDLTITGPSAFASASTNQDGGDLILQGGQKATGGGTSGDARITAPVLQDKTDPTKQVGFDLTAITTATNRTWTIPHNDIDFGALGSWNVEDTTNGNYGHGLNALDSITVGSGLDNIAIGENAGTAMTTGDSNIFIGTDAGLQKATIADSVYIGKDVGKLGTTGTSNTFVGKGAASLSTMSNANSNSAFGVNSLASIQNGDTNAAFSLNAGYNLTTGIDNTFVGTGAGVAVVSGNRNTFLGTSAGAGGTGSDNIAIGKSISNIDTAGSFQLSIGTTVVGYMTPNTDIDASGGLTIYGPSAYASAVTNQDGGNIDLKMGDHATGGGTAGLVRILSPADVVRFGVDEDGDFSGTLIRSDLTNGNYAYGSGAGDSITVGSGLDNITIGENAGTAITTGDDNIILGTDAGVSLSTGTRNVFLGREAGSNSSGASNNFFVGYRTGRYAAGSSNVGLGTNAMSSTSFSGTNNSAIGQTALQSVTSGGNNIAIGYSAANLITTASYGVFIGEQLDPASNTADSQIAIGHRYAQTISGTIGAYGDIDISNENVTITGTSAYSTATTNQDGGNLVLQAGQKASGGGTNGVTLVNDTIYGIMSVQANVTSQDDIGTTPEILTAWNTDGLANGLTVSHTNDYITTTTAGTYEVIVNASFSGTGGSLVTLEIYVYDSSGTSWGASGFTMDRKLGTGGDVGSAGLSGIVAMDTDDRIAIYITTDGATDDVTVTEAQLQVKRLSN